MKGESRIASSRLCPTTPEYRKSTMILLKNTGPRCKLRVYVA